MVLTTMHPWAMTGAPSPGSCCPWRQTLRPKHNSEQDTQPLQLTWSPPMIIDSEEIILFQLWWASSSPLLRIVFVGPPFAECHSVLTSKAISLSEYVFLIILERSEPASHITATTLKMASNRINFPEHASVYSFFIIVLWPRIQIKLMKLYCSERNTSTMTPAPVLHRGWWCSPLQCLIHRRGGTDHSFSKELDAVVLFWPHFLPQ